MICIICKQYFDSWRDDDITEQMDMLCDDCFQDKMVEAMLDDLMGAQPDKGEPEPS